MNGKRADTKKKAGLIWAALAGILVLSMLASAAVSLWVSGHSDGFYRTDMEGNTADLYPDAVESFFMYDTPYENTYIPTGEDPQMYLYAGDQAAMDTLVVYLKEPAEAAYTAQLYYRREGENLTEENSRIVTVNAGESTVCFSLPADHYEELRLDMNGAFTVEAIRVGDGGYTRVRTGNRPVSWPRTLVTGLLAGRSWKDAVRLRKGSVIRERSGTEGRPFYPLLICGVVLLIGCTVEVSLVPRLFNLILT